MKEHLLLKWGTLKGWDINTDKSRDALRKYAEPGITYGAAQGRDTIEQKRALCDLIDAVDGEIHNDWTGKKMSKDEAKKYVMEYRR